MRILVDTNVLLRVAEPKHIHRQIGTDAIESLRQRDHELVIVPQVLYHSLVPSPACGDPKPPSPETLAKFGGARVSWLMGAGASGGRTIDRVREVPRGPR